MNITANTKFDIIFLVVLDSNYFILTTAFDVATKNVVDRNSQFCNYQNEV